MFTYIVNPFTAVIETLTVTQFIMFQLFVKVKGHCLYHFVGNGNCNKVPIPNVKSPLLWLENFRPTAFS